VMFGAVTRIPPFRTSFGWAVCLTASRLGEVLMLERK